MKLASYVVDGQPSFGVVTADGVVTMNRRTKHATLRGVLAAGALDEVRRAAHELTPDHKLSDLRFLPAIPDPGKILCAGINYRSHAAETGGDIPKAPSMFMRFVDTLAGHEGEMIRPQVSECFDFEGELAVVIGRAGRHIKAEHQKISVTSGKNFPATGPLGPWIVTTDEIPDPSRLTLTTRLNGTEVQRSGTNLLIHAVPEIVAFCSDFTALSPGDVIATGTPEGVGHRRNPPLWMKAGDVLEVEISGIGTLRSRVVDERV